MLQILFSLQKLKYCQRIHILQSSVNYATETFHLKATDFDLSKINSIS